uniref:Uncharacterized protein n=1 Tax=viral metagenome TaxID=1070528 RepID=A0A6M3LAP2_9ZZZZ
MRLFGIVDGSVDRYERASLLTMPFDLAFSTAAAGPYYTDEADTYVPGALAAQGYTPGALAGQGYAPGGIAMDGV